MGILIVLPVLLPFSVGAALLPWRHSIRCQRFGLILGAGMNLVAAVAVVAVALGGVPVQLQIGGWAAPVGITLQLDGLAAAMIAVSAVVGLCGGLFAIGDLDAGSFRRAYATAYLALLGGVNGAFLTGDLFNLFVWFEVILMASFTLLVIGRGDQIFRGTTKYVALNVLSSFFFLIAVGLVYGKLGTLNLAEVDPKHLPILEIIQSQPPVFVIVGHFQCRI